jgi:protocatechuate 3,4-dioxygenase beta subunit
VKRSIVFHCALLLVAAITANAQTKGVITGRVATEDGAGLAAVTVMLLPVAMHGGQRRSTTTDEEGNFRFTDLSPRPYSISVIGSRGYAQQSAVTGSGERRYYRIGENAHISLIRGGVITGRVTNVASEPLIGIQVIAIRMRNADGRPVRTPSSSRGRFTDDRGVYRIYGLQPGGYIVVANSNSNYFASSAYFGETPTYHPSSTRDAAAEVTVASGSEASGIDIRYRGEQGHAVSGRLIGADQEGAAGPVMVYLTQAATGAAFDLMYANTRQGDGGFAFYGVPDGEYDLAAERPEDYRSDGHYSQPRRVTVRGADVTGVELKFSPRSSIAGKVVLEPIPQRCEEKTPPAPEDIVLQVHRDNADKTSLPWRLSFPSDTAADEKGEFTLRSLRPARYRLRASMPGENWYMKSITSPAPASGADLARSGVNLKPGERVSGITVKVAEGAASLRGRVTPDKTGARLPAKLVVHLVPAEAASADDVLRYAETVAEKGGAFEFKNMAPGKYRLLARAAPDDEPSDSPSAPVAWDANERAKLRREAEASKTEVELKPCQRALDQLVKYPAK